MQNNKPDLKNEYSVQFKSGLAALIPTERRIMLKLREFIQHCHPDFHLIKFYENKSIDTIPLDLPLFYCADTESKLPPCCEYQDNTNSPHLQRYVLVLLDSESTPQAAINFEINLEQLKTTILLIETKVDSYRKGYGQLLVHAAILTSAMHGIGVIEVETIREALSFYQKQGFVIDANDISMTDPESYQNVVMKLESSNPACIAMLNKQTENYPAEFQFENILKNPEPLKQ